MLTSERGVFKGKREALVEILKGLTYKPGCDFSFRTTEQGGVEVMLMCYLDNSWKNSSQAKTMVYNTREFGPHEIAHWSLDDFLRIIYREVVETVERHEMKEWFMLDGHCIYPPHGPNGEFLT